MMSQGSSFFDQLDTLLVTAEEVQQERGEDSFCASCAVPDAAMIGVFDGCGGLGGRRYPNFQGRTGAYVASRIVSGAVYDWFQQHGRDRWRTPEELQRSIQGYLQSAFAVSAPYAKSENVLKGSLSRPLPTTAAIACAQEGGDGVLLHTIWAGDSRVYLLDAQGLAQLTEDDIEGEDALSNLTNDSPMTNVISLDGNYILHVRRYGIRADQPALVIAATDGCFGYLQTPMDFECMMLCCLEEAETEQAFRDNLRDCMREVTGDDFSFGLMSFHCGTFQGMKDFLSGRLTELTERYIRPLRQGVGAETVWREYRVSYERFIREK
ncbi:MAG: protein phosphatase 2C domain-containing protein [Clostridiales bacterium]|nr:protein phosphatase 2C domain-containing protein [Clostridiales bacterium]